MTIRTRRILAFVIGLAFGMLVGHFAAKAWGAECVTLKQDYERSFCAFDTMRTPEFKYYYLSKPYNYTTDWYKFDYLESDICFQMPDNYFEECLYQRLENMYELIERYNAKLNYIKLTNGNGH